MGRLEELPDDYDETLGSNAPPDAATKNPTSTSRSQPSTVKIASTPLEGNSSGPTNYDPTPALPPAIASMHTQSVDEVADMLKQTPLFMTSLDDTSTVDENMQLEAMRALQYEGTRAEIAQGFREKGNELAREKKWSDGKEFYTKGLLALRVEKPEDEIKEDKKEKEVEEACYINRALCNLELKNYRSTILDCASTLRLNPGNIKAHYRSCLALLSLAKLPEAFDSCQHLLALDPTNAQGLALLARVNTAREVQATKEAKRLERETRQQKEAETLRTALLARSIRTRNTGQPPEMEDAAIHLVPDPLSLVNSTLVFPVVVLFPVHLQSDFIKAFGEEQTLAGHLSYLLPLPWDDAREYTVDSVEAYLETTTGGLVKWGKKVPLLKVLSGGKVEVVDGIVRVNVVPKGRSQTWIQDIKARKPGGI